MRLLRYCSTRSGVDAADWGAAPRLARRQHPLAAQAADLPQRRRRIEHTAQFYRRDLWADADSYVEIWLEKDALAGVVYPVTSQYDVPLMVARGYASLSFLHTATQYIAGLDVPAYIYHFGDHDPSGVNAAEKIKETLRELARDAEIHFQRVAVTGWQIEEFTRRGRRRPPTAGANPGAPELRSSSTRSIRTRCAASCSRRSICICRRKSWRCCKRRKPASVN